MSGAPTTCARRERAGRWQSGSDSVLLVRGNDGVLRGFYNVCRHRGHELLPCGAEGTGKFIRCPYHAWVYDTSGDLYGVPPTHEGDVSDTSQYSLVAARDARVARLRVRQRVR